MDKVPPLEDLPSPRRGLVGWVVMLQGFGLATVALVTIWMNKYRGGFTWNGSPSIKFNYHPLFMVLGMIYLYSNAAVIYRVFPSTTRKLPLKIAHGCIQATALVFTGLGLKAVFDSHNFASPPIPNLYTLHSWLGIVTVILFSLQWLLGLLSFLLPWTSQSVRAWYKPCHTYLGVFTFSLAAVTVIAGSTEKALFSNNDYKAMNAEGIITNCLGLSVIGLLFTVTYILTKSSFQRQEVLQEDERSLNL